MSTNPLRGNSLVRWYAKLASVVLIAVATPLPSGAQDVEQLRQRAEEALGQELTDQEIMRRLRQSVLSAEEIRQRLQLRDLIWRNPVFLGKFGSH